MTRLELATTGATIRSSTKLSYIRHLIPFGTPERIRTSDLLIRSQLLYPTELRALVYPFRRACAALVGVRGFEPPTPCSQSRCASQTALHPENEFSFSLYRVFLSTKKLNYLVYFATQSLKLSFKVNIQTAFSQIKHLIHFFS